MNPKQKALMAQKASIPTPTSPIPHTVPQVSNPSGRKTITLTPKGSNSNRPSIKLTPKGYLQGPVNPNFVG